MNDLRISTNHGQAADVIENHYHSLPCPGSHGCPFRLPPAGAPDAKEENEFFKDTGIRAGSRARKLLQELKARHDYLRWRGSASIGRMWQHHTLEYLDGHSELRISFSRLSWAYGWFVFSMGVVFEILFFVLLLGGKAMRDKPDWLVGTASCFFIGGFAIWASAEHMILPENMARKLKAKEQALKESASAGSENSPIDTEAPH